MGNDDEGKDKQSAIDLAKAVTEDQLTQKRKAAINPTPLTTPESSYRIVRNGVLKRREKVYLNVYDLLSCNKYLCACGLTVNHSSIEVFGMEFAFGGHPGSHSGVFETRPFHELVDEGILPPMLTLKERTLIGITPLSYKELLQIVDEIAVDWPGNSYDLLRRNCNNFADTLAAALIKGYKFPNDINRIARVGECVSCCLPKVLAKTEWTPEYELWGRHGRRLGTCRGISEVVAGCDCADKRAGVLAPTPAEDRAMIESARRYAAAAAIQRWEEQRDRPRFPSRREGHTKVPVQLRMGYPGASTGEQDMSNGDNRNRITQPIFSYDSMISGGGNSKAMVFMSDLSGQAHQAGDVVAGRKPIEIENKTTVVQYAASGNFEKPPNGRDPRDVQIMFKKGRGEESFDEMEGWRQGNKPPNPPPMQPRNKREVPVPAGAYHALPPSAPSGAKGIEPVPLGLGSPSRDSTANLPEFIPVIVSRSASMTSSVSAPSSPYTRVSDSGLQVQAHGGLVGPQSNRSTTSAVSYPLEGPAGHV